MPTYKRLSLVEKRRYLRALIAEPEVTCPHCEVRTLVADLVPHVAQHCQGPREPHPKSRWVSRSQAVALGAKPTLLSRWTRVGAVRSRGEARQREYLLRDVALRVAQRLRPRARPPLRLVRGRP